MRRDPSLDATIGLLRDPYRYVSRRCEALGTDMFETRLLVRPTICLRGAEAARLFYDRDLFVRGGAMPEPVRATLLGKGGVQGLDGAAHRSRKAMFLGLMETARIETLVAAFVAEWEKAVPAWAAAGPVRLYGALQPVLARAACAWAGVPLADEEAEPRARQLAELFDHAAARGAAHFRSRLARARAERWIAGLVGRQRAGAAAFPPGSPADRIALHRDPDGELLPPRVAAVELLNLLRPIQAVSAYIVFVAHALALHRAARETLIAGRAGAVRNFVQEVRRLYPFFPAVAARVRKDFEWRGGRFPAGRRVLLDLYGTNHHPAWWEQPESFRPERFLGLEPDPYSFVPQGGGIHATGHRCPGEWATIALMEAAVDLLLWRTRYRLPEQDVALDFSRMPALPHSRMVMEAPRLVG